MPTPDNPSQGFLVMMHLSDAREVEQSYWIGKLYRLPWSPSKLPTVWWVDPKVDGHWGDAFVGPRDPVSLCFDLLPDFIEVCKLFGLAVQKLRIFWHRDKNRCSRWESGGVVGWRVPGREERKPLQFLQKLEEHGICSFFHFIELAYILRQSHYVALGLNSDICLSLCLCKD